MATRIVNLLQHTKGYSSKQSDKNRSNQNSLTSTNSNNILNQKLKDEHSIRKIQFQNNRESTTRFHLDDNYHQLLRTALTQVSELRSISCTANTLAILDYMHLAPSSQIRVQPNTQSVDHPSLVSETDSASHGVDNLTKDDANSSIQELSSDKSKQRLERVPSNLLYSLSSLVFSDILSLSIRNRLPVTLVKRAILRRKQQHRRYINDNALTSSNTNFGGQNIKKKTKSQYCTGISIPTCLTGEAKGLQNYGHTCFLNSVLQALASLTPFLAFLERIIDLHESMVQDDCNTKSRSTTTTTTTTKSSKPLLSRLLLDILYFLNGITIPSSDDQSSLRKNNRNADPRKILDRIAMKHKQFQRRINGNEQQDAQEFLQALITMLIIESQCNGHEGDENSTKTSSSHESLHLNSDSPAVMQSYLFHEDDLTKNLDSSSHGEGQDYKEMKQSYTYETPSVVTLSDSFLGHTRLDHDDHSLNSIDNHVVSQLEITTELDDLLTLSELLLMMKDMQDSEMPFHPSRNLEEDCILHSVDIEYDDVCHRIGSEDDSSSSTCNQTQKEEKKQDDREYHYKAKHMNGSTSNGSHSPLNCQSNIREIKNPLTTSDCHGYVKTSFNTGEQSTSRIIKQSNLSKAMQIMIRTMSSINPTPLTGWMGSSLQCSSCKHNSPIRNTPFLEIPIIPTTISQYQASFYEQGGRLNSNATPSSSFPSCTIDTCLKDFTTIEKVHGVECRMCAIQNELQTLNETREMLESAISSISSRKSKNSDEVKSLKGELDAIKNRISFLNSIDPDEDVEGMESNGEDMNTSISDEVLSNMNSYSIPKPNRCEASKRLLLTRLPPVLCLHVKRLYYDPMMNRMSKTMQHIDFPEYLDLKDHCSYGGGELLQSSGTGHLDESAQKSGMMVTKPIIYKLMSVIEHRGNAYAGHYLTYRRILDNNTTTRKNISCEWAFLSDEKVSYVTFAEVQRCQAYMLFYEAI